MRRATTLTVRLNEALSEFVVAKVGEDGAYDNASEYVRDLIRRDKERAERERFEMLRAELQHAFAEPEPSYQPLTAKDIIGSNNT